MNVKKKDLTFKGTSIIGEGSSKFLCVFCCCLIVIVSRNHKLYFVCKLLEFSRKKFSFVTRLIGSLAILYILLLYCYL